MSGSQQDEETHDNNNNHQLNQLQMDAMMAKMMATLQKQLEDMRADMEKAASEKSKKSPFNSDADYYSHSSRGHSSRRRRGERDERPHGTKDPLNGLKLKLPEFKGTGDPEEYLEWEKKIEIVFGCKDYTQEQKLKLAPTEFKDYALSWWDNLVTARRMAQDYPIDSWNQLKSLMRKRFVPSHYHRELHFRLRTLSQGNRTVEEYYKEMETLLLRANVQEDKEATMARFLGGLSRDIQERLELQLYVEINELLHKANLIEKQLKRRTYKPNYSNSKPSYQKDEKSSFQKDSKSYSKRKMEEQSVKGKEIVTTSKAREIQCYKCKGYGHYAARCSNKKIIIIRENGDIETEEEKSENDNGEHEEMPVRGELLVTRRTLNLQTKTSGDEQRENLFHTRCIVQGKVCIMVIDGESCTNVASESMVEKLGLTVNVASNAFAFE